MTKREPHYTGYADLTDKEFKTIAGYIEKNVGIKMPEIKRVMMQSRLMKRLKELGLSTYKEYIEYVFTHDAKGDELILMIDALTTNKTEFFREADHFDYLKNRVIPHYIESGRRVLKIWSAGCSSGEEPYTLAIVMQEFIKNNPGRLTNYSITGTDISTKVLGKAMNATYDLETIQNLPLEIKKRYFLKGTGNMSGQARIKPLLRSFVNFSRLNFMDENFNMPEIYQVIFCRNVLIYFDKPTQENVIRKILHYLEPGGYLFLGHSETIISMNLPLKTVAPTVYKKQ